MKNLKQLETELAVVEQMDAEVQFQVTGGARTTASDDKRRERPGSNIGNKKWSDRKVYIQADASRCDG